MKAAELHKEQGQVDGLPQGAMREISEGDYELIRAELEARAG